jgi:hypothetical protein
MEWVFILILQAKFVSKKQWVEPESTSSLKVESPRDSKVRFIDNELGSKERMH